MWMAGLSAVLIIGAAGAAWTLVTPEGTPGDETDVSQIIEGQALYQVNCARCHGEDMSGELGWISKETDLSVEEVNEVAKTLDDVAPAHDATGNTARHDDPMLFEIIKQGPTEAMSKPETADSRMPGFSDRLNDEEIWAIVAYMKSHWTTN